MSNAPSTRLANSGGIIARRADSATATLAGVCSSSALGPSGLEISGAHPDSSPPFLKFELKVVVRGRLCHA